MTSNSKKDCVAFDRFDNPYTLRRHQVVNLMSEPLLCHRCGVEFQSGEGQFYVVRIEAFADPTPPTITDEDLQRDIDSEIKRLIDAMSEMSEQEAMDQVYRKLTIYLCNVCYQKWIENPTG